MADLEYTVTNQGISTSKTSRLVSGTIGVYTVKFTFNNVWDGLEKWATFDPIPGTPYKQPLDANGECTIPGEVMGGVYLRIGVFGLAEGQAYPTIWASKLPLEEGCFVNVPPSDWPEPSPLLEDVVKVSEQTFTDAQKTQARTNIDAASLEEVAESIAEVETEIAEKMDKLPDSAVPGNVAIIGSNNNIADSGISKDNLLIAPQLASNNIKTDSVPYIYRQTGGGIGVGNREYDSIVGGSVVWNQLLRIMGSDRTQTVKGVTLTDNRDGSYTLNGTSSASGAIAFPNNSSYYAKLPIGHIFAVLGYKNAHGTPDATNFLGFAGISIDTGAGGIWKNDTSYSSLTFRIDFANGVAFNNVVIRPMAFDLTQMFGSAVAERLYAMQQASAGSGIAILKRMFPNAYYLYNAGELMSVSGLQSHKTVGFNLFDKSNYQYINAYLDYSNGQKIVTNVGHTLIYLPCFPNTQYTVKRTRSASNERFGIGYTSDVPANGIKFSGYAAASNSGTVGETMILHTTTNASAKYLVIWAWCVNSNETVAKDTLCVSITGDGLRDNIYEPYESHTYPLDSSLTLRGVAVLDDNNNIAFDGDTYEPNGTVTRWYGIVTLNGQQSEIGIWRPTETSVGILYPYNFTRNAVNSSTSYIPHILADGGYQTVSYGTVYSGGSDRCISLLTNNNYGIALRIDDPTLNTVALVNAYLAQNPVTVVYELATPTTETAEPYESLQICDPLGTEEYITTGICPVGHETRYPENQVAKLDGLPSDFSTLIAPTEKAYTATRPYTVGRLLIVNNILYKVISAISSGATLTAGTNISETTLDEIIASL